MSFLECTRFSSVCVVLAGLVAGSVAHGGTMTVANPDASYLASTTKFDVVGDELDRISDLSDANRSVAFSDLIGDLSELEILDVGSEWATWSAPPFAEDEFPRALFSGLSTLNLTFDQGVQTFGFELQPDAFGFQSFTVQFFSNLALLHSITRIVDGDSGARLFALSTDDPLNPITSAQVSGGGNAFAIAQVRYNSVFPQLSSVPEPSSLVIVGTVLGLVLLRCGRKCAPT